MCNKHMRQIKNDYPGVLLSFIYVTPKGTVIIYQGAGSILGGMVKKYFGLKGGSEFF